MAIILDSIDDFTKQLKYPPTKDQWQAIGIKGVDVLVAAAAGSGKTAVLSDRISKKVADENWDIDKILVLTFTKAAAKNMKDRIEKKIEERLLYKNTEGAIQHLKRQRLLINNANISTIDSFCLDLLQRFYYLVEENIKGDIRYLSPNFKVLANNSFLLNESVSNILESYAKNSYNELDLLFELFDDKKGVLSFLKNLYIKMLSIPNYHDYIQTNLIKSIDILLGGENFSNKLPLILKLSKTNSLDEIEENLKNVLVELNILVDYVENNKKIESYISDISNENKFVLDDMDLDNFKEKLLTCIKIANISGKNNLYEFQQALQAIEKEVDSLIKLSLFRNLIVDILLDIDDEFIFKKRSMNTLDFSDMNHLAIKVLESEKSSEARDYYRDLFLEIYVDEYQDNNDLQEYILNIIRGKNVNFFRVGDVKQSIYGFRASNPELFEEKYNSYIKIDKYIEKETYDINKTYEIKEKPEGICIVLSENFRSKENILQSSNYIFNRLMYRNNAGVSYDSSSALYYPKVKKASKETTILNLIAEYKVMNKNSAETLLAIANVEKEHLKEEKYFENIDKLFEATLSGKIIRDETISNEDKIIKLEEIFKKIVATEIIKSSDENSKKEDVFERVAIEIKNRVLNENINYSDFAILTRSSGNMNEYKDILEKYNIPVYYKEKKDFTESHAFNILYNILRFLDDYTFDIGLLILLRSEIGGFSNNELLELSLEEGETLFDKLSKSEAIKSKFVFNLLKEWQNYSYNNSAYDTVKKISWDVELTEYLRKFSIEDAEVDYFNNFLNIVQESSKENINLTYTISKLEEIKENGDYEAERTKNKNSVIMSTIHNSKGLEYKNVFVVDLAKEFNDKDHSSKVIYSKYIGLTMDLTKINGLNQSSILQKLYLLNSKLIRIKNLEEEIRNFYVALTRAENKLYLVTKNKIEYGKSIGEVGNSKEYIVSTLKNKESLKSRKKSNLTSKDSYHNMLTLIFENYSEDELIVSNDITENKAIFKDLVFGEVIEDETEKKSIEDILKSLPLVKIENVNIPFLKTRRAEKNSYYPSKTSYSMLRKIKEEKQNELKTTKKEKYLFLKTLNKKTKQEEAIFKGNLIHKLFEKIVLDLTKGQEIVDLISYLTTLEKLKNSLKNVKEQRILSSEELTSLMTEDDLKKINDFISIIKPIILKSDEVNTEITFTYMDDITEFFESAKDNNTNGNIILQGVVDLLIKINNRYLLIDYKTDKVTGKNARNTLIDRHKDQLNIYSYAIKKYYGENIEIEKYIYSYNLSSLIEVE